MAAALEGYMDQLINVITCDGRNIVGVLRGFDQTINLILAESYERILSPSEAAQRIELGLYLIRGENVAVIGEMDEEKDTQLKVGEKNAELIKPVVH